MLLPSCSVPSFVSDSENFRKQKTILQLLLCGKRKSQSDTEDSGEVLAEGAKA